MRHHGAGPLRRQRRPQRAGRRDGDGLDETMQMRDAMVEQGYVTGADLLYYRFDGRSHNEKSWAARVENPLTWFFPWGRTRY
jgi:hypothetical protein